MPIQYSEGIVKEHISTRTYAGFFDVSHMGQVVIEGAGSAALIESLVPVDVQGLGVHRQTYALFTNNQGGVLDDLIITRWAQDRFFLVVNAACKEQDIAHLRYRPHQVVAIDRAGREDLLLVQDGHGQCRVHRRAPDL